MTTLTNDDSQVLPAKDKKEERKRKREWETLQKQLADEEYEREAQEQRYKSLMHLLDQSQFYSNYIMKKIDDSAEKNKENADLKRKGSTKTKKGAKVKTTLGKIEKNNGTVKKQDLKHFVSDDVR